MVPFCLFVETKYHFLLTSLLRLASACDLAAFPVRMLGFWGTDEAVLGFWVWATDEAVRGS